jgi:hypothetical protein
MMQVVFEHTSAGSLTWTLPDEAAAAVSKLPIESQSVLLKSFSSNLQVMCAAILSCFGDPGMVKCINMIMAEIATLLDQKAS